MKVIDGSGAWKPPRAAKGDHRGFAEKILLKTVWSLPKTVPAEHWCPLIRSHALATVTERRSEGLVCLAPRGRRRRNRSHGSL